jgi:uncharacterized SAM-binding protein YcdF (DUF218 family)
MSRLRRVILGLLACLVALTLLWAAHPVLLRAMARWLDVGERPRRADFVMVLTGGENTRPFAAAALVKAGWAQKVLVAEVAPTPAVSDQILPPFHEINRQVLLKRGVPAEDVVILPGKAATTRDEAKALAAFLEDHPSAHVLIVTDNYHTRRSRWAFARTLADRTGQVSFVSANIEDLNMDRWWKDEMSFVMILSEYLKLAFYTACYGYLGYWLAACCVLALVARSIRHEKFDSLAHFV